MRSGDVAAACAKYQASYTLDPQLGTLLHLGSCEEQLARLASAWSAFRDAADWAKKINDKRFALAEERAKKLEPRLSRLQLTLPDDLPPGTTIERNGKILPQTVFRSAMPLDLGRYEITVSASGYQTWRGTIELSKEGQVLSLAIPTLQEVRDAASSEAPPVPQEKPEPSLWARKWPAFAAGGVAIAGGVVWGVFGALSIRAKADAQDSTGLEQWQLRQTAYDRGTVATVGMIVTGVGAAAALTLWTVLPASNEHGSRGPEALQVGVGPSQVQVRGAF
ncbi:MAG TPA: PEGA domain-containing protein [Polyangiaceae bacterium]|nr:PEGA domain-containing protein [Polyangiaceae bacterium]